jgi:hypothetical protein
MDQALPLELLYNISKSACRGLSSLSKVQHKYIGLKSLIAVTFEEYQMLTIKFDDVF